MVLSVVAYALVAGAATYAWPDACLLRWPPYAVFATAGVFAVVRHPVYSSAIVLSLPGIALLTRSWPLLLMPLVAYAVFKVLIHREDEYLERRFGQAYLDYRARVNEVVPIPRFGKG
jgi:protein-S-isoprenylcysteine O-methyltransferase Ste14